MSEPQPARRFLESLIYFAGLLQNLSDNDLEDIRDTLKDADSELDWAYGHLTGDPDE